MSNEISTKLKHWQKNVNKKHLKALNEMTLEQLNSAFFNELEFGTAGIRAVMGIGSGFLNSYTITKIALGTANYLISLSLNKPLKICICYDNRENSKSFAQICANCFAYKGIEVYACKSIAPTPYLSYAIKQANADMGIMITASHNSSEYNGYKVYDNLGCQLTDQDSKVLKSFIDKVPLFTKISKPTKKIIYRSYKTNFLNQTREFLSNFPISPTPIIKVAYTPLCGTGGEYVLNILKGLNIKTFVVKEQIRPNSSFNTCPIPNPEKEQAYEYAIKTARANDCDIILASDPDADRVGVMVKSKNDYVLLNGNELGAIIAQFLLNQNVKANPYIVKTLVTSPLIEKLANFYNAKVINTYTGFKYIGKMACKLKDDFLFGVEDSGGYLPHNYTKDKDGISMCGLICILCDQLKRSNKTLLDQLDSINKQFNKHITKTLTYKFSSADANNKIQNLMQSLRQKPLNIFNQSQKLDFLDEKNPLIKQNDLQLTNMIAFKAEDYTVFIRPSGTEPLIKVYILTENENAPIKSILNECDAFFA